MKVWVFVLAICTIVACFSLVQTASAQTFGGYGAGFQPSRQATYDMYNRVDGWYDPQPYYGYDPGFVTSYAGFGGGRQILQVAYWRRYTPNGLTYIEVSGRSDWGPRYRHRRGRW